MVEALANQLKAAGMDPTKLPDNLKVRNTQVTTTNDNQKFVFDLGKNIYLMNVGDRTAGSQLVTSGLTNTGNLCIGNLACLVLLI